MRRDQGGSSIESEKDRMLLLNIKEATGQFLILLITNDVTLKLGASTDELESVKPVKLKSTGQFIAIQSDLIMRENVFFHMT